MTAEPDFTYVRTPRDAVAPGEAAAIVVDARPAAQCAERSLAGARCLSVDELFAPGGRLPSARDLLWLLGTAGLTGEETVVVVGQDALARDAVAGVLYVAGVRRVRVATEPVSRLLEVSGAAAPPGEPKGGSTRMPAGSAGGAAGPGTARDFARRTVFTATMRDERLVLHRELVAGLAGARLLDGRTSAEYWGEAPRTGRTGHLPGAVSLPAASLPAGPGTRKSDPGTPPAADAPLLPAGPVVAYAHDAREGFAYLTRLVAGHGVDARLYAEGWVRWASDGGLPVDAPGYTLTGGRAPAASPDRAAAAVGAGRPAAPRSAAPLATGLAAALLALAAFGAGWVLARRRAAPARGVAGAAPN